MAQRRSSHLAREIAVRDTAHLFNPGAGLAPGWCVQSAVASVHQPFFAALDTELRLCWTDDRDRAAHFDTKQAAERFAIDRLTTEAHIVPRHSTAGLA